MKIWGDPAAVSAVVAVVSAGMFVSECCAVLHSSSGFPPEKTATPSENYAAYYRDI